MATNHRPVILSCIAALDYAERHLDDFAAQIGISAALLTQLDSLPTAFLDTASRRTVAELGSLTIEPDLQVASLRAAANAIRTLAAAERIAHLKRLGKQRGIR